MHGFKRKRVSAHTTHAPPTAHADLRENADGEDDHAGGGAVGFDRQRQGEDPGQGGNPARSAAPDLRREAARGRADAERL